MSRCLEVAYLLKKRKFSSTYEQLSELVTLAIRLYDVAGGIVAIGIKFINEPTAHLPDVVVCQVCGDFIQVEHELVHYRSCNTPHYRDCWNYTGMCSTCGCGKRKHGESTMP